MNITVERKTVTSINLGDGEELNVNDNVMFIANGTCQYGTFTGLTKRGCLAFTAKVNDTEATWNVLPSSIQALEVLN